MMSEYKEAWAVIWSHATGRHDPAEPFEIDEILPEVAKMEGCGVSSARGFVKVLLGELARMPDGKQFFTLEGDAIVPLPEFHEAVKAGVSAEDAYPFEI